MGQNQTKTGNEIEDLPRQRRRRRRREVEHANGVKVNRGKTSLTLSKDNAFVKLVLKQNTFDENTYPDIDKSFTSDIRLSSLYSQNDKRLERAPKGMARKIFCYGLQLLLNDKTITPSSIIALEADPSDGNALVEKVYMPMGFQQRATDSEGYLGDQHVTLMSSTVQRIMDWCSGNRLIGGIQEFLYGGRRRRRGERNRRSPRRGERLIEAAYWGHTDIRKRNQAAARRGISNNRVFS